MILAPVFTSFPGLRFGPRENSAGHLQSYKILQMKVLTFVAIIQVSLEPIIYFELSSDMGTFDLSR